MSKNPESPEFTDQNDPQATPDIDFAQLAEQIRQWGRELGFQAIGFSEGKVPEQDQQHFKEWLSMGYNGDLDYMERNQNLRFAPGRAAPGYGSYYFSSHGFSAG